MTLRKLQTAVTFLTVTELTEDLERSKEMCKNVSYGHSEFQRLAIYKGELISRGLGVLI